MVLATSITEQEKVMSDTQEATAEETVIPNFSAQPMSLNIGGKDVECTKIVFGDPLRSIITRKLTLGDEFDLIGIAGDLASNQKWMIMAALAYSAVTIDELPQHSAGLTLAVIRARLDRIGVDGLSAYIKALGVTAAPTTDTVAAAKN